MLTKMLAREIYANKAITYCSDAVNTPINHRRFGSSLCIIPGRRNLSGRLSVTSAWRRLRMISIAPIRIVQSVHCMTPACANTYGTPKRPAPSVPPMIVVRAIRFLFVNMLFVSAGC